MIELISKALELEPSRWERFKIKHGFKYIPHYACSTIKDFLDHCNEIDINRDVLFPVLTYVPLKKEDRERILLKDIPINLRDDTGEMEVHVTLMGHNTITGNPLIEELQGLWQGGQIYSVVVRNGVVWPGVLEEPRRDETLYLKGFRHNGPLRRKKDPAQVLSGLLTKLFPEPSLQPIPIPVKN